MDHLAKERRNLVAMLMPGRGVKDRVSLPGLANAPYTCPSLLLSCCSSPEQAGGGRGEGGGGERERKGERRIGSGPLYALPALSSSLCRTKKYYDAPYLTLACARARTWPRNRETLSGDRQLSLVRNRAIRAIGGGLSMRSPPPPSPHPSSASRTGPPDDVLHAYSAGK